MIEININLVFTIINLIVLYLLMKKFLFGPILNVMEQRKNMIDQQFASAKDTEEQAYELKGKYEDALKSAKDESMRIVNQAKDEAKVQAERIVKDANTQDPIPTGLLIFLIAIPVVIIGGILAALAGRMKEIEGGEEDEASKY